MKRRSGWLNLCREGSDGEIGYCHREGGEIKAGCHSRTPSVIPAKAGIHLRMARRVSDTQTDGWIPVCTGMTERAPPTWQRKSPAFLPSFPSPFRHSHTPSVIPTLLLSFPHSFCHSRESGNPSSHGKAGVWQTNRRMDSRLHGNDGKRPPTWQRKSPALLPSFPHSFCHSRESGNPSSHGKAGVWHINRRMDSRLHGNDRKRPPPPRKEGDRKLKGEGTFLSPAFSPLRKNGDQQERAGAQSGKGSESAKRATRMPRRPTPRLPPGDRNVPPPLQLPAPLPLQLKAVLVIGGGALAAGGFQIQLHAGR